MLMKETGIALIFARGGSKRIPDKNIKLFKAKPIISYPITTCLDAKIFDKVIVSTDSAKIQTIAQSYGAETPFTRSEKSSNDNASTLDAIIESLELFEKEFQYLPQFLCLMYATSVFTDPTELALAWKNFTASNHDSLMTLAKHSSPPQRGLVVKNNHTEYWMEEQAQKRSQDLEEIYFDAAQYYMVRTEVILKQKKFLTKNTGYNILPSMYVQDIDTTEDWAIAEVKYEIKNNLR
ncbi:MAG: pseudaminic acid cytidylyltransferase [Bacteriovoracaceae bacterium]